ncbi:HD domain-containing protein [Candidatus Nomurabacteria bacterium]|nr:HD domain-containing protein [Candidatus Nomurabacteria bacterium]
MTLEETRKRIMEDDEFVLEEARRLRYLYGLKREIRYALNRHEEIHTESVAEHIYGMHILSSYFIKLEDVNSEWDYNRIQQLITWHDADEIETGDVISHRKTDTDREEAKNALKNLFANMPELLRVDAESLINEEENRETKEACFVKAIDKAEPLFECMDEPSYISVHHKNNFTKADSIRIKKPYTKDFPYIDRFCDVINNDMETEGYFPNLT